MNKNTRTALDKSIAKWDAIVAHDGSDNGIINCALCRKFFADACDGCPVAEKSGHHGCLGTPYQEWQDHQEDRHGRYDPPYAIVGKCRACRKLARAELDFLISLREPEEPK